MMQQQRGLGDEYIILVGDKYIRKLHYITLHYIATTTFNDDGRAIF